MERRVRLVAGFGLQASHDGGPVLDELGDAILASRYVATPPWIAEPSTAQASARAAVRRFQASMASAAEDPVAIDLIRRLATAASDERQRLTDELTDHLRQRMNQLPPGDVAPEVLALLQAEPSVTDRTGHVAWLHRLGALLGQLPLAVDAVWPKPDVVGPLPQSGSVHVASDGRLEVGWLGLVRTSTGLPLLLAWLSEKDCGDVRIRLVDFDNVRGD